MSPILRALNDWWSLHPHLVDLILFCVAVLVSIFPERSRRVVLAPLSYTVLGMLRFMQRDAKNHLKIMRLIDGSAFKLTAYIAFYCVNSVFYSLATSTIFFVCLNLLSYWQTRHLGTYGFNVFCALFFGGLLGRAARLYLFLGFLLHPEDITKDLEKMAAGERLE